jgi:hypothetical protein
MISLCCVCVCVSYVYHQQIFIACTDLLETWYVYHDI